MGWTNWLLMGDPTGMWKKGYEAIASLWPMLLSHAQRS